MGNKHTLSVYKLFHCVLYLPVYCQDGKQAHSQCIYIMPMCNVFTGVLSGLEMSVYFSIILVKTSQSGIVLTS